VQHTHNGFILTATRIVFVCLLVVTLQHIAHEDNQIYIGKLYGFHYTGYVNLSLCLSSTIPCNRQGSEGKCKHNLNLVIRWRRAVSFMPPSFWSKGKTKGSLHMQTRADIHIETQNLVL